MRISLFLFLCLVLVPPGTAAGDPFRAADETTQIGRYVVEFNGVLSEDEQSARATVLARTYGGRLEPYAAIGFRGFVIVMPATRALMLSGDPRVASVQAQPLALDAAPPAAMSAAMSAVRAPSPASHSTAPASPSASSGVATEWTRDATKWDSGSYAYDAAGNITAIGTDHYSYDRTGRLLSATTTTSTKRYDQQFEYDRFGNLLRMTTHREGMPSAVVTMPVDSATNQLQDGDYDQAGNQRRNVLEPTMTYTWDQVGMMQSWSQNDAIASQSIYDADDERVLAIANGQQRYSLRGLDRKVVRDFVREGGTWRVERDYVYRDATLLASFDGGTASQTAARHFHTDQLGTPRFVTDSAGATVGLHTYQPFGSEVTPPAWDERLKFTGHERDAAGSAEVELDYMHARYYAPGGGRFLSVDPNNFWQVRNGDRAGQEKLQSHLKKPRIWNRYAYVSNNPINATDPDGRETYVITTFDYSFGSHSAVLISRNGENVLFDPAGSYVPPSEKGAGGQRGSGDVFEGTDANLKTYVDYQKSTGSDVKVLKFNTTPQQEATIKGRIEQQPGIAPGSCAVATSTVISGVGPFKDVKPTRWPGRLYERLKDLLTK